MRILVLSAHTSSLFWFRMNMMQSFIDNGHEVYAIGSESEETWKEKFNNYGIIYRQIPVSRNGLNPLADIKTCRAIKKLLKEICPDKIFAYQAKSIVYGSIAAKQCGISEFYSLIAGLGSIFRGSGLKNSFVRTLLSVQYKNACKISKKVIFQNNDDRDELLRRKIVIKDKTEIVNGSGVDLTAFVKTDLPERIGFLFIGRLIKDKGVKEYLEACKIVKAKYPKTRCMLIGPFDSNPSALLPDELEQYTKNGTVEYFGEQSDIRPYLKATSVYVLPSYHEGTPKTVLEAMAMGRAIITTDAPGCRETVKDGLNGFLMPVKDVSAVAEKMMYFIENPDMCAEFGNESRVIAEEKYDVNKVNETIMNIMSISKKEKKEHVTL